MIGRNMNQLAPPQTPSPVLFNLIFSQVIGAILVVAGVLVLASR